VNFRTKQRSLPPAYMISSEFLAFLFFTAIFYLHPQLVVLMEFSLRARFERLTVKSSKFDAKRCRAYAAI